MLAFALGVEIAIVRRSLQIASVAYRGRPGYESAKDAGHQRIRAQAVRAVILVFALAGGIDAGNVGGLVEVHPQPAHGVVHAGEDLHRRVARIVADKLLVDLENAFELAVEDLAVDVGQVEIDHRLAVDAEVVLVDHLVNGAGGDVARHQVAVLRIPLFQEVPALGFGDALGSRLSPGVSRNPDAAAFAARRLRHQAQLVFARNGCGVHLDELAVGVVRALLIQRRLRRAGADHGIRATCRRWRRCRRWR